MDEFQDLIHITLQSKMVECDFTPKKVPRDLGILLQHKDPKEEYFKVFIYPTHAELWYAREWRESTTRYRQVRERSAAEREQITKENNRAALIYQALLKKGMPKIEETQKLALALSRHLPLDICEKLGIIDIYNKIHETEI